jgi:hypothetical protein
MTGGPLSGGFLSVFDFTVHQSVWPLGGSQVAPENTWAGDAQTCQAKLDVMLSISGYASK